MWKYIVIFVACLCGLCTAYSVASSRQVVHYHYPAPPQGERLQLPQFSTDSSQDYQTRPQQQQQRNYRAPLTTALTSGGYSNGAASFTDPSSSESIRLPLPLGVASINVGPLPLSEGVTYSSRPGLTSYGTPYPQRV